MATSSQIRDFLATITPLAQEAGARYGISPSIIITQAALESEYGTKPSGQNNLFGVKGHGSTVTTHEQGANGLYKTKASFRDYPDIASSVNDYASLLARRYPGVTVAETPQQGFQALKDAGYATDAKYVPKLNGTLATLQRYGMDTSPIPPAPIPAAMPSDLRTPVDTSLLAYAAPNLPSSPALDAINREGGTPTLPTPPSALNSWLLSTQPIAPAWQSPVLDWPTGRNDVPLDVSGFSNPGPINQGVGLYGQAQDLFGGLTTPNYTPPIPPAPASSSSNWLGNIIGSGMSALGNAGNALGSVAQKTAPVVQQQAEQAGQNLVSNLSLGDKLRIGMAMDAKPWSQQYESLTGTQYAHPVSPQVNETLMAQQGHPIDAFNPPPLPQARPQQTAVDSAYAPADSQYVAPGIHNVLSDYIPGADVASLNLSGLPIPSLDSLSANPMQVVPQAALPAAPQTAVPDVTKPVAPSVPQTVVPPIPATMSPGLRESRLPVLQRLFDATPVGHVWQAAHGVQPNGGILGALWGVGHTSTPGQIMALATPQALSRQNPLSAAALAQGKSAYYTPSQGLQPTIDIHGNPVRNVTGFSGASEQDGSPFW